MTKLIVPFFLTMLVMAACSQAPVDYEQLTVAELQKLAEQGDPAAQLDLGYRYFTGEGVPQDHEEAVRWIRASAEQGDPSAQYRLGFMYSEGEGVPQDPAEAVRWYRMAAEQGYADAQNQLGFSYRDGRGVPQDDTESARWFRAAAEQGNSSAQYLLGVRYGDGQGVPQDYVEAHKWFNLASVDNVLSVAEQLKQILEHAVTRRDELAKKMTPGQLAEAQRLAAEWKPKPWEIIRQELKIGKPQ